MTNCDPAPMLTGFSPYRSPLKNNPTLLSVAPKIVFFFSNPNFFISGSIVVPGYEAARRAPGKLTLPQVVKRLGVPLHWAYQRLRRGEIVLPLDPVRKLYLFPDTPEALAQLQDLKAGRIHRVQL